MTPHEATHQTTRGADPQLLSSHFVVAWLSLDDVARLQIAHQRLDEALRDPASRAELFAARRPRVHRALVARARSLETLALAEAAAAGGGSQALFFDDGFPARLDGESEATIAALAARLRRHARARARVSAPCGCPCPLGLARAQAMCDALGAHRIPRDRLSAVGGGSRAPRDRQRCINARGEVALLFDGEAFPPPPQPRLALRRSSLRLHAALEDVGWKIHIVLQGAVGFVEPDTNKEFGSLESVVTACEATWRRRADEAAAEAADAGGKRETTTTGEKNEAAADDDDGEPYAKLLSYFERVAPGDEDDGGAEGGGDDGRHVAPGVAWPLRAARAQDRLVTTRDHPAMAFLRHVVRLLRHLVFVLRFEGED